MKNIECANLIKTFIESRFTQKSIKAIRQKFAIKYGDHMKEGDFFWLWMVGHADEAFDSLGLKQKII
jgi:hypothetical protein